MFRLMAAQIVARCIAGGIFPQPGWRWIMRRSMRRAAKRLCEREPGFIPYWKQRRQRDDGREPLPLHPRLPRPPRARRTGPMEIWELYQWHLARGTLHKFFKMFPPGR
jgi:hypothetical protein